ncbi:MAG: hypothetical protein Q9182_007074 [Xanthomendoza sp. 2 TL-2023]
MTDRLLLCQRRDDLEHDSAHWPIETAFNVQLGEASTQERYAWHTTNKEKLIRTLTNGLPQAMQPGIDGLEAYTNQFTRALHTAITLSTKKATIKPNYSNADFDEQCSEAIKETRKAKRILIGVRKSVRDQYGPGHDNHPDIVAAKEHFTNHQKRQETLG